MKSSGWTLLGFAGVGLLALAAYKKADEKSPLDLSSLSETDRTLALYYLTNVTSSAEAIRLAENYEVQASQLKRPSYYTLAAMFRERSNQLSRAGF